MTWSLVVPLGAFFPADQKISKKDKYASAVEQAKKRDNAQIDLGLAGGFYRWVCKSCTWGGGSPLGRPKPNTSRFQVRAPYHYPYPYAYPYPFPNPYPYPNPYPTGGT